MEHKDYNMMAEHGVTDMEYAEFFGMPEEFIGTPKVNDYMLNYVYNDNITAYTKDYVEEGMEPAAAQKKAVAKSKKHMMEAKAQLKIVSERRGY